MFRALLDDLIDCARDTLAYVIATVFFGWLLMPTEEERERMLMRLLEAVT